MKKIELEVMGMMCNHCAKKVSGKLQENENIKKVVVKLKQNKVIISYCDNIDLNEIKEDIRSLGYEVK